MFNQKPNYQTSSINPTQKLLARQNSGESLYTSAGSDKLLKQESHLSFDTNFAFGNFKPTTNNSAMPNNFNSHSVHSNTQSPYSTQSNYGPTSNQYFSGMNTQNRMGSPFSPQSMDSPGSTYSTPNFTSNNPFKANSTAPISTNNFQPQHMTPMVGYNSMTPQNPVGAPSLMGTGIYPMVNQQPNQTQPRMMMRGQQPQQPDSIFNQFSTTNPTSFQN